MFYSRTSSLYRQNTFHGQAAIQTSFLPGFSGFIGGKFTDIF
jgi:hypothetical protein